MALNFSSTTDDASIASGITGITVNQDWLICGWYKLNTLTAGRGYWGFGSSAASPALFIASTTDELRFVVNAATDGEWVSNDADIVVDRWHFIAVLISTASSIASLTPYGWIGVETDRPRRMSAWTNTIAPSGTVTATGTTAVGTAGTSTSLAMQGMIDYFAIVVTTGAMFPMASGGGSITSDELDIIERDWVFPIWQGEMPGWDGRNESAILWGGGSTQQAQMELGCDGGRSYAQNAWAATSWSGATFNLLERRPLLRPGIADSSIPPMAALLNRRRAA